MQVSITTTPVSFPVRYPAHTAEQIEAARNAARARIAARHAVAVAGIQHHRKVDDMRRAGKILALHVVCGHPLVRVGGGALRDLREECYDAANNTNGRAGMYGIDEVYATALMGGEPYAIWNQ